MRTKMSKELSLSLLEIEKHLKDYIFHFEMGKVDKMFISNSFEIIEKALKALEIIKEKRVNVEEFIEMFEDWKEITYEKWIIYYEENGYYIQGNEDFDYNRLTQEEYDLLKEVLL